MILAYPRKHPLCYSRLLDSWFCPNATSQALALRCNTTRKPFYSSRSFTTTKGCRKKGKSGSKAKSEADDEVARFLEEAAQRTRAGKTSSSQNNLVAKPTAPRTRADLNQPGDNRPFKPSIINDKPKPSGQIALNDGVERNRTRDYDRKGGEFAGTDTETLLRRWYQEALEHLQAHQAKIKSQHHAARHGSDGVELSRSLEWRSASNVVHNDRETILSPENSQTDMPYIPEIDQSQEYYDDFEDQDLSRDKEPLDFNKRQQTHSNRRVDSSFTEHRARRGGASSGHHRNRRKFSTFARQYQQGGLSNSILESRLHPSSKLCPNGAVWRSYTSRPQLKSQLFPENQAVETGLPIEPISKGLPVSPFQRLQAKKRQPKARADAESRLRLAHNPWAQLLASPVRRCQASATRMPNKLLVPWNLVRNPRDDLVYLMPNELVDMTQLDTIPESQPNDPVVRNVSNEHEKRSAQHEVEGDGMSIGGATKATAPMKPARTLLRSSSILLTGLSRLFGSKIRTKSGLEQSTRVGTVARLLSQRFKDQARRFQEPKGEGGLNADFLTEKGLRRVQWHTNINGIMHDLLRLRIRKSLKLYTTVHVRDQYSGGRIIPLWSDDTQHIGREIIDFGSHRLSQAVLFRLGPDGSSGESLDTSESEQSEGNSPSPTCMANCKYFSLDFVKDQQSDKPHDQRYTPRWTRSGSAYELPETILNSKPMQKAHHPPSIRLTLPPFPETDSLTHSTSSSSSVPSERQILIPIFNLTSLLGPTQSQEMQTDPFLVKAFGFSPAGPNTNSSSWVLVMAGDGTQGTEEEYKTLVHELWRLWLFQGGRAEVGTGKKVLDQEEFALSDAQLDELDRSLETA